MSASYTDLFVHLVWTTAGRKPWITASVEGALFAGITAKCRALRCPPIAVGGVADHVHLLVALSPVVAVATLMREVKGVTSHLMTHELVPGAEFRWQRGYGAFSLRRQDTDTVQRYVLRQKSHHAKGTSHLPWESTDTDEP